MKKRLIFLGMLAAGILSAGCTEPVVPAISAPSQTYYVHDTALPRQIIPLGEFNRIVISGPASVLINGEQPENQLTVTGPMEALKDFTAHIQQGVLYIDADEPVNVALDTDQMIQAISYQGNEKVTFKNLPKQAINLSLGGNSVTQMTGEFVFSQITLSGNAVLHAYWVDTSNLHIMTKDNAKLFLAGVVTKLDIQASGRSIIDAKSLRADTAYVKTSQDANVSVNVKRALSTLSTGRSTVYYYRDSDLTQLYLADKGSALRMKGIPPFYVSP